MKMRMSLQQHEPDDHILWAEIYDRAERMRKVIDASMEGFPFRYALISSDDGLQKLRRSYRGGEHSEYLFPSERITEAIAERERIGQIGFSAGDLAFVMERLLPRLDFADYVGLHQYAEMNARDDQYSPEIREQSRHGFACQLELMMVLKRDPEFQKDYAQMLVDAQKRAENPTAGYFGRAIPPFVELVQEGNLTPVELMQAFKRQLDRAGHLRYYGPAED